MYIHSFIYGIFSCVLFAHIVYGDESVDDAPLAEHVLSLKSDDIAAPAVSNQQKVYNWFKNLQHPNGLLESVENGNIVSLYDQALAALVFLVHGDIENAETLFSFFDARIDSELRTEDGGFLQFRDKDGELFPDRKARWMGDNAWLLIALNNYKSITGKSTYDKLAKEIEQWLRSIQDTDGGLIYGTRADGTPFKVKVSEGIIDAYNAVPGYDVFHSKILQFLKTHRWGATQSSIISWPGNKYHFAMDLHPWSYCIFENFPVTTLAFADKFLITKEATANGAMITGYCFDIDNDTVWLEGTGQMVVAFNRAGRWQDAAFYLKEMEKVLLDSKIFEESAGVPYATNPGTAYSKAKLWPGADTKPAISGSAWYLFGKLGFDPFAVGRTKNAPAKDRFWVKQN